MPTITYQELFTVQVAHNYYTRRLSPDLAIVPTPETEQRLRDYRLLWRPIIGGLVVLAPVKDKVSRILKFPITENDGFRLLFQLRPATPYFRNFTALSWRAPQAPFLSAIKYGYYFTNFKKNTVSIPPISASPINILSQAAGQPAGNGDRIVYLPHIFNVQHAAAANFTVKLRDFHGVEKLSNVVNFETGRVEYQLKFGTVPAGFYALDKDGVAVNTYLDERQFWERPFGLVELFHNNQVHADFQFVEKAGADYKALTRNYYLYFESRSTFWRYRFAPKLTDPGNLKVEKTGATFNETTVKEKYESTAAIKLSESYQKVELKKGNSTLRNLPNPGIESVTPDESDPDNKVFSEIFV